MAKSTNGSLEAAMALLIQNQAAFLSHVQRHEDEFADIRRRLERIEGILTRRDELVMRHDELLTRHDRILTGLVAGVQHLQETIEQLPEAIRQKIGFKSR